MGSFEYLHDETLNSWILGRASCVEPWTIPSWFGSGQSHVRYADNMLILHKQAPEIMSAILRHEGEHACYFIMLNPDPSWYESMYGKLPILALTPEIDYSLYHRMLGTAPDSTGPGIAMVGDVMVVLGRSDRWFMYYQRSRDMVMIVTRFDLDLIKRPTDNWWLPLATVKELLPYGVSALSTS